MAMQWKDYYEAASKGIKPRHRARWRKDADQWLGALGLLALGTGLGFAIASLYGPDTTRWRGRLGERFGFGGGFERQDTGESGQGS
jgi:hypothetical protein